MKKESLAAKIRLDSRITIWRYAVVTDYGEILADTESCTAEGAIKKFCRSNRRSRLVDQDVSVIRMVPQLDGVFRIPAKKHPPIISTKGK